ncbi:MAG: hypothetical protein HC894_20280 [Microcoleus sp. SM1_3_4]|nr:hypothetical protein [Microcoleus sp. SM1_3_4]
MASWFLGLAEFFGCDLGDRSYFDVYADFAVFVNGVVGSIGFLKQNFILPLLVILDFPAVLTVNIQNNS